MDRIGRLGVAVLCAAAVLVIVGWLDGTVLLHAQRDEASTFDIGPLTWWLSLGYLVTAAGILTVALVAWWARSLATGIIFLAGGAFFAFLDVINWQLAAGINGAAPVLPEPVANAIAHLYFWQGGPLSSMRVVGAGIFLVGLAILVLSIRRWMARPAELSSAR